MAKKRVTLPNEIHGIITNKDFDAFKAIFDKCNIDAYDRNSYNKRPALFMSGIPISFVEWLLDNGADIQMTDYYGHTALHQHYHNIPMMTFLLSRGADILAKDKQGNTPLHHAESNIESVKFLLEQGVNPLIKNNRGFTPLQYMLSRHINKTITETADIAELLLNAGDTPNEFCQEKVKEIGENFEFHRSNYNPEYLAQTQAGLDKLYRLFNVTPVAKRVMHDGTSPIIAQGETLAKQFEYLWQYLIPSNGKADTVQGELIRIAGRVQDEIYRNGAVNWGNNYKQMLSSFVEYLSLGEIEPSLITKAKNAKKALYHGCDDDEAMDDLIDISVAWVKQNPNPVKLEKVTYDI